jgi:tripartite-type tricarboxylate transporter receptor subunit TctC
MRTHRLLACLLLAALPAGAQEYPARPIRLIVGFVPGGVADLLARALGQKLTEAWSQQVIVDNRAGAGGAISLQLTAKSVPDGYTLLLGSSTGFSVHPAVRPNLPYDPIRDYTPVTRVALTPVILTVQATHPARSISELIQIAKAKPGQPMNYGSPGQGGAPHIAAELVKKMAGIDLTHVPYKGGGESVAALLGGHVQMTFGAVSTSLPHLRSGRLRSLGVTSAKRLAALPDVPVFAEAGLPGFEVEQWYGVFGPAGIAPAIVRRLNEALVRVMAPAAFKEHFVAQGVDIVSSTPAELGAYVKSELARWTKMLKEVGITEVP